MTREISYSQALYEGFDQLLESDNSVFVIGQGLWSPWYVGSTMNDFEKKPISKLMSKAQKNIL